MNGINNITRRRLQNNNLRTFITLAIAIFIVVSGLISTYAALLKSARNMGVEFIKSYAADEERDIAAYKTIISMGLNYIDKLESDSCGFPEAEQQIRHFMQSASSSLNDSSIDFYAIYRGKLLSLQNYPETEKFDFRSAEWYQNALNANGEIVFADVNTTSNGERILSVAARANPENGNAVFVNLRRQDYDRTHNDINLPALSSYYLFSENGELLYSRTPFSEDESVVASYEKELFNRALNLSEANIGERIKDLNNVSCGLYYSKTSNGSVCVMTIPHSTLFSDLDDIILMYSIAFIIIFAVICIITFHDRALGRRVVKTDTTISALCNTYYAIYRINLKDETYDMIKGSEDIQHVIPKSGKYNDMLNAFAHAIDEKTGSKMAKAFSLEHIKKLVSENVRDFGGDFVRNVDGVNQWINIGLILDDSNPNEEAVIAFRQIDNEKQQQLRHTKLLESALAAADESEKSQKRFFSKMSHEMRTPLNIILGMNELAMRPDCTPEKRLDYQQKIEYAGTDMLKLINNILRISRIEDGLMPIERKEFNLCEEFGNIVQPFKEQALREGKRFTINIDVKTTLVFGDTLKLSQILNNLISNALQFTNKNDSITVSMRQAGADSDNYVFTIEDTGIGIAEERLPDIFLPYYRDANFRDRSGSGGGLGLAIVKSLVSQKGGTIQINSKLGKGTNVIVTLPFAAAEESDFIKRKTDTSDSVKGLNILVVDDNELNRELMVDLFAEHGANVKAVSNGKDAISEFENSELFGIDAIIMDMQMPEMDGCETTVKIREIDRDDAKWVLIIALTANYFSEDIIRTVQAGMNAHLTKPVDMDIMQKTLADLIAKRSAGEETAIFPEAK